MHGLGEFLRFLEVRRRRLPPQQIGIFRECDAALDAMGEPRAGLEAEETFRGALAGNELAIAIVHISGDQLGALRVGARQHEGRRAADVGCQTRRDQVTLMRRGRDQHLAAHVAALLLGRELVLEVNAGSTCLDVGLHDLERVQRATKACFRVGDDWHEPVDLGAAFGVLDLVGTLEGAIDAAAQFGAGIRRVEALVGIHRARGVGVGGDLPARQIDRGKPGARLLHRLVAGDGAQRIDEGLFLQRFPKPIGTLLGQRVGDRHGAAQLLHLGRGVGAADAIETPRGRGNQLFKGLCHHILQSTFMTVHCEMRDGS